MNIIWHFYFSQFANNVLDEDCDWLKYKSQIHDQNNWKLNCIIRKGS